MCSTCSASMPRSGACRTAGRSEPQRFRSATSYRPIAWPACGNATRQRGILEQGNVEEALGAVAAIDDDRIRRQSGGSVNPETWTHGSSKQRVAWFRRGFQSGRMQACETFSEHLVAEDG